jgi:spermidine synthase
VVLRESLASLELLFYREGTTATVAVTRLLDGRLHFSSDGKVEADTSPQSMVLQRMMGHVPMLLHPNPRRVLNIGLGAGVTSGALSCYPETQLEIADIEPAVTNVAAIWAERNHDLIRRGRHTLFINDGRNHLLVTTNRYDVITSDPFEPVVAGAASLYTVEHFQLARSRLAPGGLMAQFLPLYELSRDDLLMIVRTFARVFPRASVFFTGTDTILLGLTEGAELRLATAAAKFAIPEVRASLAEIGMDRPERLLDMLVMDLEPGDAAIHEGRVNSDNHPFIEFSAPAQRAELPNRHEPEGLAGPFQGRAVGLPRRFDTRARRGNPARARRVARGAGGFAAPGSWRPARERGLAPAGGPFGAGSVPSSGMNSGPASGCWPPGRRSPARRWPFIRKRCGEPKGFLGLLPPRDARASRAAAGAGRRTPCAKPSRPTPIPPCSWPCAAGSAAWRGISRGPSGTSRRL